MCGIWMAILEPGRTLAGETGRALLLENSRRGPHAHGYASHHPKVPGIPAIHRRLGPPTDEDVQALRAACAGDPAAGPARAIIGHSRLATTGPHSQDSLDDIQPLRGARLLIAHNGTVPRHLREHLPAHHQLELRTGNDSEILLRLAERALSAPGASTVAALTIALNTAIPPRHPHAVILLADDLTWAASRWQLPLNVHRTRNGTYLSSRQLPGFTPLPEGIISPLLLASAAELEAA